MKIRNILFKITLLFSLILIAACSSKPKNAEPVQNFNANKYLGTWYEIARFDYIFEKNLNNVSANYTLDKNGNIIVFNSGFNVVENKWKSSTGIAKFRLNKNVAALKVSFFKPFYAGYNVVAIDDNYKYALIAGKDLDYLWILSREKTIPEHIKTSFLQKAKEIGYNTTKLIWVEHNKKNPLLNEK
ncbi:lipocalin family protein [Myroides sp. JBRI-B21084]|uniref:lipocalin family protein n=1 Tax=Myroides sp. JBRI-B21084 TaxID=3119977 RepID=UPI0026E46890|nr:lipocalin family protein [Paenimyroides cloacae]WKW46171.1 lipocalin family protein [Paenimyroides cloacae]